MKKSIIPFLAIATLLASCGGNSSTGDSSNTEHSSTSTAAKYSVTASKGNDYKVEGLAEDGYEAGATVSFTVSISNTNKEVDKVIVDGTQLVASNGTYSFTMPSKNVNIIVQLKDKAGVKVATIAVDNEAPKVGDTVNVTLKLDGTALTSGVTITATSGADLVTITGTAVKCNDVGAITLEASATVDGIEYKKTIDLTIGEATKITSIKTIQDVVPTTYEDVSNGKQATYDDVVTVEGRVVAYASKGVLIYDGTAYMYINDNKITANIGEYLRVSGTPTRFRHSTNEADIRWWQISYNSEGYESGVVTHAEIALPSISALSAEEFAAYVTPAAGEAKYVSFTGTYKANGSFNNIYVDGVESGRDIGVDTKFTLELAVKYNFEGFLAECKNGGHVVFYITKAEPAAMDPVESVTISDKNGTIDDTYSATLKAGQTAKFSASVLPATANPNVTWTSSDATKAKVDEDGTVTGVAEGEATITATADGKDSSGNPVSKSFKVMVEKAEVIDPSQMKLAASINLDFSDSTSTVSYKDAGSIASAIESNNGLTVNEGYDLSLTSSSGETSAYYAKSSDSNNTKFGIEGIKLGTGKLAGGFVLTFNETAQIVKVTVKTLTSWYTSGKKSSLTINGVGDSFVTANKGGDVDFTLNAATNVLTFSSDKVGDAADFRVIFTGLDIYVK